MNTYKYKAMLFLVRVIPKVTIPTQPSLKKKHLFASSAYADVYFKYKKGSLISNVSPEAIGITTIVLQWLDVLQEKGF